MPYLHHPRQFTLALERNIATLYISDNQSCSQSPAMPANQPYLPQSQPIPIPPICRFLTQLYFPPYRTSLPFLGGWLGLLAQRYAQAPSIFHPPFPSSLFSCFPFISAIGMVDLIVLILFLPISCLLERHCAL